MFANIFTGFFAILFGYLGIFGLCKNVPFAHSLTMIVIATIFAIFTSINWN